MNENIEMLEYIVKDCDMAIKSLTTLIRTINNKDNKIKNVVEGIIKGYENILKDSKGIINKSKYEISKNSKFAEMGSYMGVKMELLKDNSDSRVADMLIKGLTMGTLDMDKKINKFSKDVDKDIMSLAKKFYKFQQESIEILKPYL